MVSLVRTSALLPLITPYAPTCPDFIAEQHVRLAAITLAERSRAWRHVVTANISPGWSTILTATVGGQEVELLFTQGGQDHIATAGADETVQLSDMRPSAAVIHEIEFAEFDGQPLTPMQFSTARGEAQGRPRYITQVAPNTVRVMPFASGKLEMSLFLKPASGVEYGTDPADPLADRFNVIPDFFISLHGNALAAGALARILSIPDSPWTDMQNAARYDMIFRENLNGAFRANMRGQQRAKIRTKFSDF